MAVGLLVIAHPQEQASHLLRSCAPLDVPMSVLGPCGPHGARETIVLWVACRRRRALVPGEPVNECDVGTSGAWNCCFERVPQTPLL
jgi:hypothetical protein